MAETTDTEPKNAADTAAGTDPATPPQEAAAPKLPPRVAHWCSMLLDLSRRNRLLNFKDGAGAVRLAFDAPEFLEDAVAEDKVYRIVEVPEKGPRIAALFADAAKPAVAPADDPEAAQAREFLSKECAGGRLYALAGESGNAYKRLLGLYRAARNDLEEGGTCTLFLALGVLRWKDGKGGSAPVYRAPLVLYPVELKRLPGKEGFSLRRTDEDPAPNVTLLEMLRREQRVEVPGADPMPEDEHGVDLAKVLASYRAAVAPLAEWSVEPEVWIGRFSFNKFLMWRDLSSRLDDLARSPIVAHLLAGGGAFDDGVAAVDPSQVDALSDAAWPPCPVAADSSQLSAVMAAVRGRNFVLHGPPGTGKSQTITNLIACCMAAGKTVLFVAEKRAALEVVQRRLRKIGLAPFCLELHSNKAGKAEVLRQFKESLDYGGTEPPEAWDATLADLRATRRSLDGAVAALHRAHPCGLTPYRAFSYLMAHAGDAPEGAPELPDAPLSEGAYEASAALAGTLAAAARDVPDELYESFGPIGATEWTPAWAEALAAAARPLPPLARALCRAAAPLGEEWDATEAKLLAREQGLAGRAAFAADWPGLDEEKAAALDAASLRAAWDDLPNRFFLARPFKRGAIRRELLSASAAGTPKPKLRAADVPALLDALDALRSARADAAAFGAADPGVVEGVVHAWEAYRPAAEAFRKAAGETPSGSLRSPAPPAGEPPAGDIQHSAFSIQHSSPSSLLAAAEKVLELAAARRPGLREWCRFRAATVACAEAGLAPLAEAVESGALPADAAVASLRVRYCERFTRAALDADATLRDFFGGAQDAAVEAFAKLDAKIAGLSRDMVLAHLTLAKVKATKDRALSAELSMLNHEVAKKTRQKPPRLLLEAMPGLLPVLKPCLLMSPLSVAQYLPAGQSAFDVVVFDEASQLTVWDAIGVLARGKQAVVVGDPKQLPPTNFFQKGQDARGAEDEEPDAGQEEIQDLDSILDECKAAGVPEQALLWHYRSRHESLIAFSNERYYEGRLYTFPSAAAARKGLGVRRVKVDGVYDRSRTRTNRREAETVVAAVVERLLDPAFADKTCGVVTFSMAQQGLIEDLLDEEQARHPEIQRFFDPALPEPFFVKNLENVQGDERDAIFFSIGYAPDEKGYFAMNFGPLNRPGGERRLNVAVTRAKEEVVVFTSIESTQIDLSRTAALGAAHLREFLSYAERADLAQGGASRPGEPNAGPGSGLGDFENEVAEVLRCHGYAVDERVGRSGYRIDLAVRAQPDDGSYAIAVECDGDAYRSASSARDRDVSRRSVLEGLGWRVARCWCLEWWFDRERAEAKLLAEVDAAVRGLPPPETGSQVPPSTVSTSSTPSTVSTPLPPASAPGEGAALAAALREAKDAPDENERVYEAGEANRDYAKAQGNFNANFGLVYIREQVLRIVNAEGPITEDLLAARVFDEWGIKQATAPKLAVLRKGIPDTLPVTTHQRRKVYWPVGEDPAAWHWYRVPTDDPRTRRTFAQIPFEEWAAALEASRRALGPSAEPDALLRDALARLGLPPRITAEARPTLEAALKAARKAV